MKMSSTFHISVFLMVVLVCSMPFIALAQQNSVEEQAKMAAKRDAETDTNQSAWFGVGCASTILGGAVGIGVGSLGPQSSQNILSPFISDQQGDGCGIGMIVGCLIPFLVADNYKVEPRPERLLGKSPEYVDFYTSAYKTRVRQLRKISVATGYAFAGCFGSMLAIAALQY